MWFANKISFKTYFFTNWNNLLAHSAPVHHHWVWSWRLSHSHPWSHWGWECRQELTSYSTPSTKCCARDCCPAKSVQLFILSINYIEWTILRAVVTSKSLLIKERSTTTLESSPLQFINLFKTATSPTVARSAQRTDSYLNNIVFLYTICLQCLVKINVKVKDVLFYKVMLGLWNPLLHLTSTLPLYDGQKLVDPPSFESTISKAMYLSALSHCSSRLQNCVY